MGKQIHLNKGKGVLSECFYNIRLLSHSQSLSFQAKRSNKVRKKTTGFTLVL